MVPPLNLAVEVSGTLWNISVSWYCSHFSVGEGLDIFLIYICAIQWFPRSFGANNELSARKCSANLALFSKEVFPDAPFRARPTPQVDGYEALIFHKADEDPFTVSLVVPKWTYFEFSDYDTPAGPGFEAFLVSTEEYIDKPMSLEGWGCLMVYRKCDVLAVDCPGLKYWQDEAIYRRDMEEAKKDSLGFCSYFMCKLSIRTIFLAKSGFGFGFRILLTGSVLVEEGRARFHRPQTQQET
ncbi:hypothetical protein B0H13DRAFT_1860890 [Mycena leptocephala]|nr:hypothetical protein B0H13DRAFT_1860890 [Mycena leptocephala]